MIASQSYVIIAIVVLIVLGLIIFAVSKKKKEKNLTPLAGLAFAFIIAGILFGDSRIVSYGLMGAGVILAIADIMIKSRKSSSK